MWGLFTSEAHGERWQKSDGNVALSIGRLCHQRCSVDLKSQRLFCLCVLAAASVHPFQCWPFKSHHTLAHSFTIQAPSIGSPPYRPPDCPHSPSLPHAPLTREVNLSRQEVFHHIPSLPPGLQSSDREKLSVPCFCVARLKCQSHEGPVTSE